MSETVSIYESASRRLPDLEAEAIWLTDRLKAVRSEIADVKDVLKNAPAVELSENVGKLPASARPARGRKAKPSLGDWKHGAPGQENIIAGVVNGAPAGEGTQEGSQ